MMKKLMSFALAFTFVFVGANAADAAPDQPVGDDVAFSHDVNYTADECAGCHNPEIVPVYGTASHNDLAAKHGNDCGDSGCHGTEATGDNPDTDDVEVAGEVQCGACHTTQSRASWEKTFQEDTDNTTNVSDDNVAGDKEGHHLEKDGSQKACTDCHVNRNYTDSDGDGTMDSSDTDMDGDGIANDVDAEETYVDVFYTVEVADVDDVYSGNVTTDAYTLTEGATIDVPTYDETNSSARVQVEPAAGEVEFNTATGAWTYTPDYTKFTGTDSFVLRGYDENGNRYFMNITVTGPVAVDGTPGNGLPDVDGTTDLDEDGLTYDQEKKLGTDPYQADTDGDTAPDGKDELPLDPKYTLLDQDKDGLTNAKENELGTDPLLADTDKDGLTDGEEVELKTNPLLADTDGDKVNDSKDKYPLDKTKSNDTKPKNDEKPSNDTNPETGVTAGLMLSVAGVTAAGAGLVVSRKRK